MTDPDPVVAEAHARRGIVTSASLGRHPGRSARQRALVPVQPRVYAAATQPLEADELVAAVQASRVQPYALLGPTALWRYGLASEPDVVQVGVAHSTRYRARPPLEVRRVSPALLRGSRTVGGVDLVALEVAVVQASAGAEDADVLALVERVLRERRTTVPRLRSRCRRGVRGSAAVRRAVDVLVGTSLDGAVRTLKAALEARGITGLSVEVRFESRSGASAYADLLDERSRTAIEVDGYVSHTERARFRADRRRDRWMHAEHDLVTARVDVAEVTEALDALADELAALVRRRRAAARAS